MKTLVKILIAVALIGALLLGFGLLRGGKLPTPSLLHAPSFSALVHEVTDGHLGRPAYGTTAPETQAPLPTSSEIAPESEPDVQHLVIEITGGSCEIVPGDRLELVNGDSYANSDGTATLKVSSNEGKILLPDQKFESVTISATPDADVDIEYLHASTCTINARAEIEYLCADEAEFWNGECEVDLIDAQKITFYSSQWTEYDVDLVGKADDYRCTIPETNANVFVNDKTLHKGSTLGNDHSPRELVILMNAGNLELDFENDHH